MDMKQEYTVSYPDKTVKQVIGTIPKEGTYITRYNSKYLNEFPIFDPDNSLLVDSGPVMQKIYDSIRSSEIPKSDVVRKAWETIEKIRKTFRHHKSVEKTLEKAAEARSGVCVEKNTGAACAMNQVYGNDGAVVEGGEVLRSRHRKTTSYPHAWCRLPKIPLIVDASQEVVGIPIETSPGTYIVFSNETVPKALACHVKLCAQLQESIAEDAMRFKDYRYFMNGKGHLLPSNRSGYRSYISGRADFASYRIFQMIMRDAAVSKSINDCHDRIYDNLKTVSHERKSRNMNLPFEYRVKPQVVAVKLCQK